MSVNENATKLRHFLEEIECKGLFDQFEEYVHPDVVLPTDLPGGQQGVSGLIQGIRTYQEGIQYQIRVQDILCDGDKVAFRNRISGKQTGKLWNFIGVGKEFAIDEVMIAQFREGRVCRFWRVADRYALIDQLGMASE